MASWNPISPYTPKSLFISLFHPWLFLGLSLSHIPATIWRLWTSHFLSTLLSPSAFKAAWFGSFWATVGPTIRDNNWPRIVALLDGRVSAGQVSPAERANAPISGTVLEVGPGSGLWVGLFAEPALRGGDGDGDGDGEDNPDSETETTPAAVLRQRKGADGAAAARGITKVYGVEPNADMHAQLRASVAAAGLEGVYEIVPAGIEALALAPSGGRVPERGSVDAVVSLLCLCSIPDPERNIRELYSYLRPGGRWYVFEHVRCRPDQGRLMAFYQAFMNLFWPRCIGGCELRRDTARWLTEAGPWSSVDLDYTEPENWAAVLPHIFGTLTK